MCQRHGSIALLFVLLECIAAHATPSAHEILDKFKAQRDQLSSFKLILEMSAVLGNKSEGATRRRDRKSTRLNSSHYS